jgi:hypothetical protein
LATLIDARRGPVLAPQLNEETHGKRWIGWVLPRAGARGNRSLLYYHVRGFLPVAMDGSPLLRGLTRVELVIRH